MDLLYQTKCQRTTDYDKIVSKAGFAGFRFRPQLLPIVSLYCLVAINSACTSPTLTTIPGSNQGEESLPPISKDEGSVNTQVVIDIGDGKLVFISQACGGCHTVQGIPEAQGKVGPELTDWSDNPLIADTLTNTDENLRIWLKDPPAVKPASLMPNQNLTNNEINALINFLRTLK